MAEERKDSFAETVDTAASAAHTVKGAINIQRALINEEQRTNDCDYVIPESATAPGSPDGSYVVGEINGSYEKLPA